MHTLTTLFHSPEFYPQWIDFEDNVLHFLRMSRESYRSSVFLDVRTEHLGDPIQKVNLDDVLRASATNGAKSPRAHYILNTAFCCSTLLARYFELFPDCFVLKEPIVLTQLATVERGSVPRWEDVFEVCVKLLSRTYLESERPVIKVHEACNVLGSRLLKDPEITITFLSTPVRRFVLSVLKAESRREWARHRLNKMSRRHEFAELFQDLDVAGLSDAQTACCMWLANSLQAQGLSSSDSSERVLVVNGDDVAERPLETLTRIAKAGGFAVNEKELEAIVSHPSVSRYSKDSSIPFNATSRQQELEQLDQQWGEEARVAIHWMQDRAGHVLHDDSFN
jgi:hypothetical protein